MGPQSAWATGFLTQLILRYLERHYPGQSGKLNHASFFSSVEGSERLRNPGALLQDSHAYLPEEVLREVLAAAENISGRKDVAYHAALEYFTRSGNGDKDRAPSIFEIIAMSIHDVRLVALSSHLWAGAYTTFLRLQPLMLDPSKQELVILSQYPADFSPLFSMHYMLKGNYEGFVRLYDFVDEAFLEEEFLQYRIADIVGEFEGYQYTDRRGGKVIKNRTGKTVVELTPYRLNTDEIKIPETELQALPVAGLAIGGGSDGSILHPENHDGHSAVYRLLSPCPAEPSGEANALRVIRGGTLRAGTLSFRFKEGDLYEAPYSRYRFRWLERPRAPLSKEEIEKRVQEMGRPLFEHLRNVKAAQQRLLAYAVENKALTTENVYLRREVDEGRDSQKLLGESQSMISVMGMVSQIAPTDSAVLITGETGTGKELIARLIHAKSRQHAGRFVAMNCASVSEGLIESELFGHERGAFSGAIGRRLGRFELAHGGTLFLDEIGDISPSMQVKLLRVLQERSFERVGGEKTIQVDVRVIAATNQNLQDLVSEGRFRKDLYYRLNVIPIQIAPLRERPEDIPLLAEYFLKRYSARLRKRLRKPAPDTTIVLKAYSWPGNVRELENIMERVVTLAPDDQSLLTVEMLPSELRQSDGASARADSMDHWIETTDWDRIKDLVSTEGSMDNVLRRIEWSLAKRAIRVYGNKSQAARALKRTYRWIRKLEKQMDDSPLDRA
jgi:transcriptional regulator with GAF, ATPase, and Fis domain